MMNWPVRAGETPYEDLDGFLVSDLYPEPTRQQVDALEEENIRKATLHYIASIPNRKMAPFDYYWFLQLHADMYGDVWDWAGKLRTQNTQIGYDKHLIGEALRTLAADIHEWPKHFEPIEIAARLHHQAVKIHPFKNGNGRWSRLLSNIWQRQNGYALTMWPSIVGESPVRQAYLEAVKAADNLNYEPLITLHQQFTSTEM